MTEKLTVNKKLKWHLLTKNMKEITSPATVWFLIGCGHNIISHKPILHISLFIKIEFKIGRPVKLLIHKVEYA